MSKLILFDFVCQEHGCGHRFEELVKPGDYWAQCPRCGGNAQRQLSAPRVDHLRMATSASASPASIDYFERVHQERKAQEVKCKAENGDYGKPAGCD